MNIQTNYGLERPGDFASDNNHLISQIFKKHSLGLEEFFENYNCPLHKICSGPNISIESIFNCIERYTISVLNQKNQDGQFALHLASVNPNSNKEILGFLLSNKADINSQGEFGWTPLHYCIKNHKYDFISFLIENKSNLNALATNCDTPLHLAIKVNVIPEKIKYLINQKSDINTKDFNKDSLLHSLCSSSEFNHELIQFLIEKKADLNSKNYNHSTPLDLLKFEEKKIYFPLVCYFQYCYILIEEGNNENFCQIKKTFISSLKTVKEVVSEIICKNLKQQNSYQTENFSIEKMKINDSIFTEIDINQTLQSFFEKKNFVSSENFSSFSVKISVNFPHYSQDPIEFKDHHNNFFQVKKCNSENFRFFFLIFIFLNNRLF